MARGAGGGVHSVRVFSGRGDVKVASKRAGSACALRICLAEQEEGAIRTQKSPPLRRSPLELMLEAGWDGAGGSVSTMHVHDEQRAASLSERNRGTHVVPPAGDWAVRQLVCELQRARALNLDARILLVAGAAASLQVVDAGRRKAWR